MANPVDLQKWRHNWTAQLGVDGLNGLKEIYRKENIDI